MINNCFIKKLLPSILFCLIFCDAYSKGIPRSHPSDNGPDGIFERAHSHNNILHEFADVIIHGTVRDENSGLSGATIRENGTNNVTTSKDDGTFSLKVSKSNAVLTISFIGYETREIALEGRTVIDLVLKASSGELSNVVVTALGISREKKSLGYSIGEVAGKDINRVAQENVLNSLAGKLSGVTISQTGGTGSSVSMVIRGANSLSNDNQPLFVVDGVPIANTLNNVSQVGTDNQVDFGNAISSINPDDVANVTVLKGPSAAALYGSRAGNGVVLITTKSGRGLNKLTVSVTSSTVFDMPYKFLNWQDKFGSGLFSAIPVELTGNILTDPFGGLIDESAGPYGGELDQGYTAVQWNSPLDANGNRIPLPLVSHPDNVKNFVQTGLTSNNSISIANSSDAINYRLSYSSMTNKGIIPNSDLFRNTLDMNSSVKVNNKVRISTNINLSRNNSNSRPSGSSGTNPLQWAYAVSPHIDIKDLRNYWVPGQEGLQQLSQSPTVFNNPYFMAYEVKNSFVRDRLYGNIQADWQLASDFSVRFRYGLDTYTEQREFKVPTSYTQDPRGAYGLIDLKSFESNADLLVTYKKDLNKFNLSASAGASTRYEKSSTIRDASKDGTGLIVPNVYTIQNILPSSLDYSNYSFQKGTNSIYGIASLGFEDKAFLDVTARNDWSSTLPNVEPYFYPSASLSLLINKIARITSSNINLIKLRGGVAQVGNDASPYQLLSVLSNAGTWGNVPRLTTSGTLLNPDLKPEIATSYEGGIDVALFKNRFNFSATYYVLDNQNQIFTTQLPPSSGYDSKNINAGLVRSNGIELTVGGTPVETKNFRWDISTNLTKNRTKIIELAPEMPYFTFWEDAAGGAWTYKGEEVGDIYGAQVKTVTDKSSPYYGYPLLEMSDGGAKWQSIDAHNTRNKIGNFNPKFIMGLQTSFTYKNWSVNMSFDWRNGGQFVSQTYRYGMENGNAALQLKQLFNAGSMSGKQLRDYLVAHADQMIKVHGNQFPRVGWPTPEHTSYPFQYSGINLPYGGVFIPGVYASGYDAEGNPTGYIENLGENVLGTDPSNPNATLPVPYAASDPWSFTQADLFSASYLKLREISFAYEIPVHVAKALRLQDANISVYSRNITLWTAAKIGIDPENAYQPSPDIQGGGIQFKQGIEKYNVTPWSIPLGIKLHVTF